MIKNIMKIIMAKTSHAHFDPVLLSAEKVHKAQTIHIAKTINWMKLIENPIMEKAAPEKNHFLICCGNITFMELLYEYINIYVLIILIFLKYANFMRDI